MHDRRRAQSNLWFRFSRAAAAIRSPVSVADHMARAQKLTTVIENRPGAGTTIATEAVSRAAPDGNTVLLVANSFVINPSLKALNYDPHTSFEPICLLTRSPNAIVVNSASPYRSLSDLVAAARARPGELTMAFQGPATSQHIGFEKLIRAAGIDMIRVPFTGAAPAVNALLGGHVASLFVNYPSAMEQVRAGKLRAIAIASGTRIASLPDVPSIRQAGYADYKDEDVWFGFTAPARTPRDMIVQLAEWFTGAIRAPEVEQKLAQLEFYPAPICAHERSEHAGTASDPGCRPRSVKRRPGPCGLHQRLRRLLGDPAARQHVGAPIVDRVDRDQPAVPAGTRPRSARSPSRRPLVSLS